jgi:hypothetical protein
VIAPPAVGNGPWPGHPPQARDDTTRYLCAAAHRDPAFANNAIREFLVESTRPAPVSGGVDPAAVLSEAVAARTRRKLRDSSVIVLLLGFVVLAPGVLLGLWVVLAILLALPAIVSGLSRRGSSKAAAYAIGGVIAVVGAVAFVSLGTQGVQDTFDEYSGDPTLAASTSGSTSIGAFVLVAAILAVLLADRLAVWRHLHERFWPNRLANVPVPSPQERTVFRFTSPRFVDQIERYARPVLTMANPQPNGRPPLGDPVPLIVYRDYVPFVGAGRPEEPWSIAVPLEDLPDARSRTPLTTASLYAAIRTEILALRRATPLTPGRRLAELGVGEVVIASADELVDHFADPATADFLHGRGVPPFTMIRRERAESIKVDPLEWARYYQRFQVETWDRDLVISVFVHVAVAEGTLYVEWTPCVLRPIRKEYREIDQLARSPLRAVGRAVVDLLKLPVSLFGRVRHTLSFIRPLPQDGGAISPAMYGASASLRELAADATVTNYFQLSDVDRYLKSMESRLVLAVSRAMRAAGYSPASFSQQAATVVNNNVQIGGSVTGNVVAGADNKVGAVTAPVAME